MHTLRFRILLLLTAFSIAFLGALTWWQVVEQGRLRQMSQQAAKDDADFVTRIVDLKGASLGTFVLDYTIWDDLCKFIRTRDRTWAKVNLDDALGTYDTDAVWVYDADMRPVYGSAPELHQLDTCPISADKLRTLVAASKSIHFYCNSPIGLLELFGAPVYVSADRQRRGTIHGYMICGRLWDRKLLTSISHLTGARASLVHGSVHGEPLASVPTGDGTVVYTRQFLGLDGVPVRALRVVIDSRIERMLSRSSETAMALVAAFACAMIALLFRCLVCWVSRPLRRIMTTLQSRDIAELHALQSTLTEFGDLARLVQEFFSQQEVLLEEIAERTRAEAELQEARDELEARVEARTRQLASAYDSTIEGWSAALDLRDQETEGHCRRVTEMTLKLARAIGMSDAELVDVRRGALLHDIGKMGIPDAVLLKPGPLDDEEWKIMRMHPVYAYNLLSPIDFLKPALAIPYCHHEKWDGTGYPRGLKGEEIPLEARLFCIVDVWDALRSDRPYRKGWPDEKIYDHIKNLSGTHFQPEIVDLFLRVLQQREDQQLDLAA